MHPSNLVVKRYRVALEKPFPAARLKALIKGITIEGERLKVERATLIAPNTENASTHVDVHMHHGKKREIRQLFSALGFDVERLRRYQIGAFELKGLPLRSVKILSPREIAALFKVPPVTKTTREKTFSPRAKNHSTQRATSTNENTSHLHED